MVRYRTLENARVVVPVQLILIAHLEQILRQRLLYPSEYIMDSGGRAYMMILKFVSHCCSAAAEP